LSRRCAARPAGAVAAVMAEFWSLSSGMERRMLLGIKQRAQQ
jgi:hypothetical protein